MRQPNAASESRASNIIQRGYTTGFLLKGCAVNDAPKKVPYIDVVFYNEYHTKVFNVVSYDVEEMKKWLDTVNKLINKPSLVQYFCKIQNKTFTIAMVGIRMIVTEEYKGE